MFRVFLRRKLATGGQGQGPSGPSDRPRPSEGPGSGEGIDRRVFARYPVDHKHLTIMNDADILLVRDVSAKGFSTEVSPRASERLVVDDQYDARMRYLGELYDLEARVAWKAGSLVGFEVVRAKAETLLFIQRLLRPIALGFSLKAIEASFTEGGDSGKSWYRGDEGADLNVWQDPETNELRAWQLVVQGQTIDWSEGRGLVTGSLSRPQVDGLAGASALGLIPHQDQGVDPLKRQLALDVLMALQYPVRDELLATFSR